MSRGRIPDFAPRQGGPQSGILLGLGRRKIVLQVGPRSSLDTGRIGELSRQICLLSSRILHVAGSFKNRASDQGRIVSSRGENRIIAQQQSDPDILFSTGLGRRKTVLQVSVKSVSQGVMLNIIPPESRQNRLKSCFRSGQDRFESSR